MAQYYPQQQQQAYNPQNLQFYQSTYAAPVSGHSTPSQATYGYGQPPSSSQTYPGSGGGFGPAPGFGGQGAVSGRMGEQGGLRTGWIAAFGTEGYDGEPPLLEELGVNFGHIKGKVRGMGKGFLCSIYAKRSGKKHAVLHTLQSCFCSFFL